jgi:two-component system, chemotaxis family, sensor kinase CheA
METRDYLPAFVAEAREHLQELGLAVLRIEAAPDDGLASEGVFRIAHSLKGMAATMGFEAIVALTHAMEDVFELLRQRAGGLPREAIDVLSACLDALESAVEAIAAGSSDAEALDPSPLVARLEALTRARTPVLHVVADFADDCAMPAVRAFMLFEALRVQGELLGGVPALDAVESFDGRRIEAWIATRIDADVLAERVRAVGELASVVVRPEAGSDPSWQHTAPISAPEGDEPHGGRAPRAADGPPRASGATVRVDAERLDELLHLMGELVQQRTTIEALASRADVAAVAPDLPQAVQRLARTSQALQETVTRVRMVPVESVFLRFPRLVRDLAARLDKQVELRLVGADVELDRTTVDALADPLMHLVRNALDHGLEPPAERVAAGKPPTGLLELSARHAGGHVVVSVRDDGRGVDPAAVGRAAVARGLLDEHAAAALEPAAAAELLFAPGFSTAAFTTDLSGRGVGMDAVRNGVRALGGDIAISSEFRPPVAARGDLPATSQGTLAELRLPLTLASIHALLVEVDGLACAIPLERVVRTVRFADHPVRTVRGEPLLPLGEALLPICDVARRSPPAVTGGRTPPPYAVVVNSVGGRRVACAVDDLVGQRELVTRPLPRDVATREATAGAVLPDGSIALVLDCDTLASIPATEGVPT